MKIPIGSLPQVMQGIQQYVYEAALARWDKNATPMPKCKHHVWLKTNAAHHHKQPLPTWWWQIHAIRCAFLHGNWCVELNFYKVFTQGDWIEMRVMLLRFWILHLFKTMNYFTDYFVLATWHSSKIPRRKSVLTKWQNVKKFKGYENFYTVPQF